MLLTRESKSIYYVLCESGRTHVLIMVRQVCLAGLGRPGAPVAAGQRPSRFELSCLLFLNFVMSKPPKSRLGVSAICSFEKL